MAWAGTTTYIDPKVLNRGVLIQTTNIAGSTKMMNEAAFPGGTRLTTGTDVVRFPFNNPDGKMVIAAVINESTLAGYPVIAIRLPPTSDDRAWRSRHAIGTSTAESGWKLISSSTSITLTTAQNCLVTYGPFESAEYGHVFASSSNGINAGQPYLECMFRMSSAGSTDTVMNSTTLYATPGAINLLAFEVP